MRTATLSISFLTLVLAAGGCTNVTTDPTDPMETSNRQVFGINQDLDRLFLRRTAKAYNAVVPEFGRNRIHDLLNNLALPATFANDLLQGEGSSAGQTALRFTLNSTLGIGGLFDPATEPFGVGNRSEDFGQTLGTWGVGGNPYLMLPILGPSSPRDAAGLVADIALDPLTWLSFKQHIWWLTGRQYLKLLDIRASNLAAFDEIERSSIDFYAATRSLYRQHREDEIQNGRKRVQDLPDF